MWTDIASNRSGRWCAQHPVDQVGMPLDNDTHTVTERPRLRSTNRQKTEREREREENRNIGERIKSDSGEKFCLRVERK